MKPHHVTPIRAVLAGCVLVLTGCTESPIDPPSRAEAERAALVTEVRELASREGLSALPAPPPVRGELVELGRALAFDKILSGNRDISCMTCHPPAFATGDGRSLAVGQGASGLGPSRVHPDGRFIPRNAPQLFNLHMADRLFWDGRVESLPDGGFRSPAGAQLTAEMREVFEFGALSVVPLFPVTSRAEMRADSENELAALADDDFTGIWSAIMERLGSLPAYRAMFELAYPGTAFEDMSFAHAANAIAGFFVSEFASVHTPWDRFLHGEADALSDAELRGARAFVELDCVGCHTGPALSDMDFHSIAAPQVGPGEGDGGGSYAGGATDDFGRERATGNAGDRYRFRTPMLRNVELTAPYGHAGQFVELDEIVLFYDDVEERLLEYDPSRLEPLLRPTLIDNYDGLLASMDPLLNGMEVDQTVAADLSAFLRALTDEDARSLMHVVPESVPSGLPVDR